MNFPNTELKLEGHIMSGESDYDTTQADLSGTNLPENDHFTVTSGNVTEYNIKIHLRKLGCKE